MANPTSPRQHAAGSGPWIIWHLAVRLLIATFVLALTFGATRAIGGNGFTPMLLAAITAALFLSTLVFAVWVRHGSTPEPIERAISALDTVLISGFVYVTGGLHSLFVPLFGVNVLTTAIALGARSAMTVAGGSILVCLIMGGGMVMNWLPAPPDQSAATYRLAPFEATYVLSAVTIGLGTLTVLASSLASRLSRAGGRLLEVEGSAQRLAQLNEGIVRSITSGVITLDAQQRIKTMNPIARVILADEEQTLVGRRLSDLFDPAEPTARSLETTSEVARTEATGLRVDGSRVQIGFSLSSLNDAQDRPIGSLFTFQDLTEIRALRNEVERAHRLAALGRLSAGLAHEIRNPLSSIAGSVEIVLENSSLPDEDQQLLRIVSQEAERLNQLVTTMLQVGRPLKIERTIADLRPIVVEVCNMAMRDSLLQSLVKIRCETPERRVDAFIDPDQVRQVLWNLVKNGAQASPVGAEIIVRVGHTDNELPYIEVVDHGVGMPEAQRAQIFDAFYSGREQGVGLGLALVKQIVERHHADLLITSQPGTGTTMRVVFPDVDLASRESSQPSPG